ncbi:MAG: DUF4363 family protein [Oscillospiraceae bacterium]
MKRLLVVVLLLLTVFSVTSWNSVQLKAYSRELSDLLTQAEAAGRTGNWQAAQALTNRALQRWRDKELYLHITLRHADTDRVYLDFQEVRALTLSRDVVSYAPANQRLLASIELLYEMEQLSLKNVL